MEIKILRECGYEEAMLGLSLSYNADPHRMPGRACKLAKLDPASGELKFLEFIETWMDITAPRYWWAQMDTYRPGVSKQSQSTMHTILRRPLCQQDFEGGIDPEILGIINAKIDAGNFDGVKRNLPEAFLQRRIFKTNYKTILHIVRQRHSHRLAEWQEFCEAMRQLEHSRFIFGEDR